MSVFSKFESLFQGFPEDEIMYVFINNLDGMAMLLQYVAVKNS